MKPNLGMGHLETPDIGQAVIVLTWLLEVFISEIKLWKQYRTLNIDEGRKFKTTHFDEFQLCGASNQPGF